MTVVHRRGVAALVSVLSVSAACSGSSATSSVVDASMTAVGTIDGKPVPTASVIVYSVKETNEYPGEETSWDILFLTAPGITCSSKALTDLLTDGYLASTTTMQFSFLHGVEQSDQSGSITVTDDQCNPETQTEGSAIFTVDTLTATQATGSYAMTFGKDMATGPFTALVCPNVTVNYEDDPGCEKP